MPLGWNEIKERAIRFSKEWENAGNEDADAKTFLEDFFNVFGISRRRVASFEHKVKKLDEHEGYIDLLWKGMILIEMKSRGKNLDRAYQQAKDYLHGLKQHELPKYVLISDFQQWRLYDLDEDKLFVFELVDLVNHVQLFASIAGYQKRTFKEEDPVNIEAAYLMGKLHDALEEAGYSGHELEVYLVRLLFCLFADDTTIFERDTFHDYILDRTGEDGTDLGMHLALLFQVLNTPNDKRQKTLDESLAAFPFVNGHIFEEQLTFASFNTKMRQSLLECCALDWSKISPAIFGSMFQSVMNPVERRNLGAHYTSEKNILKLIRPLFLDDLRQEFESVKNSAGKLHNLQQKISSLRFLDPACGCGNFLVITYRELRMLELDILKELQKGQQVIDLASLINCNVDRFYGIEYEEFPAQIAQVALWLMDHQMNMLAGQEFGEYFVRLPLKKSAKIMHGNALRADWEIMIDPPLPGEEPGNRRFNYILGNPPFVGKQMQSPMQKLDMELIFNGVKGAGVLDYVSAWYIKTAQYLQKHNTGQPNPVRAAFVSTNSIAQGEQVGILWNELFNHYKIKIHFAHRTFKWGNEARGNAAVHVVIIGFSNFDIPEKLIYEYEDIKGEPHERKVSNINPYLVEGKDDFLPNRKKPIFNVQEIVYGSFALDDGNYTLTEEDKNQILKENYESEKFIKPFIGGRELLHAEKRYCLWLINANPVEINSNSKIKERVAAVKKWRANSERLNTKKLSETPTIFAEIRQPKSNYLAFPTLSSENRKYIPIAFLTPNIIASNQIYVLPNASLYNLGILTSILHMAWIKSVCGRLKSDIRYSASVVYNNFPWPENPTEKQKEAVEKAAQKVLDTRAMFPGSSLADLYDPLTMPPALVKAHQELDKAVDLCYRPQPFASETKRIEYLFELYDKYTAGMFGGNRPSSTRK